MTSKSQFLVSSILLALCACGAAGGTRLVESENFVQGNAHCSIEEYGVVGNGQSYDTVPMQAAIDACFKSGGGRLVVASGMKIITGTLWLRSNIELHLEEGAVILGGIHREDYPSERELWYVVVAQNATNVSISGPGEINGQAHSFVLEYREEKNVMLSWNRRNDNCNEEDQRQCRPRLVGFVDCKNVTVRDVHLTEPAFWCLHVVRCDTTTVDNVTIYGDFNIPNNDAIDVDGSNNTVVQGCHISTGDDGVCAKTKAGPTFNLSASECWIRSKSSAVKIGSETRYDMGNLSFVNMTIVASHRGLAIQARDQGNISDVSFVNVTVSTRYYDPSWWGRAEPIYITSVPRRETTIRGSLRNVSLVNVSAQSENGIVIAGSKGNAIEQLRLENVTVSIGKWSQYPGGLLDYRPGYRGLVPHQTAGVFVEHVAHLVLRSVDVNWGSKPQMDWGMLIDMTPGTIAEVILDGFRTSQPFAESRNAGSRNIESQFGFVQSL